jgi:hypothetical protein
MALGISILVAGLACRPQRSWLLSLHDNQHDTPSFLKSLLNFFVAKREESGVALTMSLGKWKTIAVKRHYRLVWATKVALAAICLVFPALVLGYKSLNLEEPISSGYPAQPGLTWRNQFLLVTQPTQD